MLETYPEKRTTGAYSPLYQCFLFYASLRLIQITEPDKNYYFNLVIPNSEIVI